jgi:hypothetical protein
MKRLPPDPENMKDACADWVERVVFRYTLELGTDDERSLTDLLCDLMHWSDRNGVDFADALRIARLQFDDESAPEPSDF